MCIRDRLYIAYYHGMVVALHYVKLSPYNRIVESGRNLTHTSTYRDVYKRQLLHTCCICVAFDVNANTSDGSPQLL